MPHLNVPVLIAAGGGGAGLTTSMLLSTMGIDSLLVNATAAISDRGTGEDYQVQCQYLVGADGGHTVGPALGIKTDGMRDVVRVVSFHISADLSAVAPDPDVLIRWIPLPHTGKAATMVPMGPDWGLASQEWVVHLNYEMDDIRALDDDTVIADLRHALGVAGIDITVHLVSRWCMVVGTAPDERYVTGGELDCRLRVVEPQPGMTPDDGVDGELDGAGQAQPPGGSCDGTSEDGAGRSCAGEVFLEHVHLMRVSRSV